MATSSAHSTQRPDGAPIPADRLLAQERLLRAEAEHRVANLLQFAVSNLARAARDAERADVKAAIVMAAGQLTSIGRLQRVLGHGAAPQTERCDVKLEQLCVALDCLILGPAGHRLTFEADLRPGLAPIGTDVTHCLELIVTELVINAAKHAFPAGIPGQVAVTLRRTDYEILCKVSDDGGGLSPRMQSTASQGMGLVDTLAAGAGGRCRWVFNGDGTQAEVVLPLIPAIARTPTAPKSSPWRAAREAIAAMSARR